MKNGKAFTLIEILVAIAIVAILAAVVLVSLKGYGAKSRASKAHAQLSSVIPSMVSCWGNGGNVNRPNAGGGNNICSIAASYGQWPKKAGNLSTYSYTSRSNFVKDAWWVRLNSVSDKQRICCNSAMDNCKIISYSGAGSGCNATTPSN